MLSSDKNQTLHVISHKFITELIMPTMNTNVDEKVLALQYTADALSIRP